MHSADCKGDTPKGFQLRHIPCRNWFSSTFQECQGDMNKARQTVESQPSQENDNKRKKAVEKCQETNIGTIVIAGETKWQ